MVTKQWVAVHRKHHAKVETAEDPHSPQIYGIARVLWAGVFLYVREAKDRDVLERYGHGTPNDWLEAHVYARCSYCGLFLMGTVDSVAFGLWWGMIVLAIQLIWVPFFAAGVINGAGHYWGYRNYPVEDASTNLFPIGVLIGGEEFHNNHHAHPTSAKLSSAWYEFDIGWMYIRLLELVGLAHVGRLAPIPKFSPAKTECDADTVRAVVTHRYYVLAQYTRSVRKACRAEMARLKRIAASHGPGGLDAAAASQVGRWLRLHTWDRKARGPLTLDRIVRKDQLLQTVCSMRDDLSCLWSRSVASGSATAEESLKHLREWRARAAVSDVAALREFARRLPHWV
jgi:stearoyl-CoA desaturase (Delta-9 desaturase)